MSSSNFVYSSWNFFPGAIQLAECEALKLDTVFVCKLCLLPFAILRCYFGSFRCSLALPFNVSGIRFPPCQPRSLQKKHICQSVGLYEQKKMMPIFSSQQSLLANYIGFHYETKRNKEARKEDRRTIQICFVAGEELSCKNGSDWNKCYKSWLYHIVVYILYFLYIC